MADTGKEKWPDDVLAVVCLRVTTARGGPVVRGSVKKACCRCESLVWTSPATLRSIPQGKFAFLCVECARTLAEQSDEETKIVPPSPEQIEEIREQLRQPPPENN
jgi:hypothetical protein